MGVDAQTVIEDESAKNVHYSAVAVFDLPIRLVRIWGGEVHLHAAACKECFDDG